MEIEMNDIFKIIITLKHTHSGLTAYGEGGQGQPRAGRGR